MDDIKYLELVFQFLMVRLKVILHHHCPVDLFISIPYGAIKSQIDERNKNLLLIFQFLMVRLKEECV